jgi:hypothetical protein
VHSETPTDALHLPNPLLPGFNPDPSCVQAVGSEFLAFAVDAHDFMQCMIDRLVHYADIVALKRQQLPIQEHRPRPLTHHRGQRP